MDKPQRAGSLDVADDTDFQRASWKVQRVGWIVMLAIAIAALMGAFGGGPLSSARASDPAGEIAIEFERFPRLNAPHSLAMEIAPAAMQSDSVVHVWLDRKWLDANEVRSITPEPASSSLAADRVGYSFVATRASVPLRIVFRLETRAFGRLEGRGGIANGASISFRQFAYP